MNKIKLIFGVLLFFSVTSNLIAQNAKEIVKKADEKMRGKTLQSEMTIKIIRPDWEREMSLKVWMKGNKYSMILITSPAKDEGTSFLKRKKEVWNWVPSVEKVIKLPPSMMNQSWMGTDFTNDDLVKEASIVEDYDHSIIASENISGKDCYKIELIPQKNSTVVWGKIILWIDKNDYLEMKSEFYDEDGNLINTMNSSSIKQIGGRTIPTYFEMIPADKPNNKTILIYNNLIYDSPIEDDFFTTKNMKDLK